MQKANRLPLNQFIHSRRHTLLNNLTDLTLLKSRTLPITHRHPLQPFCNITNIHPPQLKQPMTLNQIPRCARIKQFLPCNRTNNDTMQWRRRTRPVRHETGVKVRGGILHRPCHRRLWGRLVVRAAVTGCSMGLLRCCAQDLVLRSVLGELALQALVGCLEGAELLFEGCNFFFEVADMSFFSFAESSLAGVAC